MFIGLFSVANIVDIPGWVVVVMSSDLSPNTTVRGEARFWYSLGNSCKVSIGENKCNPS